MALGLGIHSLLAQAQLTPQWRKKHRAASTNLKISSKAAANDAGFPSRVWPLKGSVLLFIKAVAPWIFNVSFSQRLC